MMQGREFYMLKNIVQLSAKAARSVFAFPFFWLVGWLVARGARVCVVVVVVFLPIC